MNGLTIDANGRILHTAVAPGVGAVYNDGFAFTAGALHTTTAVAATDTYESGLRRSATGQLVTTAVGTPGAFNEGVPCDLTTYAVLATINQVPAAADAYVAGKRVSPTTGLYLYT